MLGKSRVKKVDLGLETSESKRSENEEGREKRKEESEKERGDKPLKPTWKKLIYDDYKMKRKFLGESDSGGMSEGEGEDGEKAAPKRGVHKVA